MRTVMYIFLNRDLEMSIGKASAQVGHAAVEAYLLSDPKLIKHWREGLHYTKLVMLADDSNQLQTIQKYIEDRGFKTQLIIDEGRTEIKPFSMTALGVEIVDKDEPHVAATFESFKLYKEKKVPEEKLSEAEMDYYSRKIEQDSLNSPLIDNLSTVFNFKVKNWRGKEKIETVRLYQ